MTEGAFELEAFYSQVCAVAKERGALRQDLVRGLKDYFTSLYGYDRYGAETVLLLSDRMMQPHIYGYGVLRILHDRRVSESTKVEVAQRAIEVIDPSSDNGMPFGLVQAIAFLTQRNAIGPRDVRYALVASAGTETLFQGADRASIVGLLAWIIGREAMPSAERAFWGHSLIARCGEGTAAAEMAHLLLGAEGIEGNLRREVASSWVNARQPRLFVDIPDQDGSQRSDFVLQHMPFWVSHALSWPSGVMVRVGLLWLARLGEDPAQLAERYLEARDGFSEPMHTAIADILREHAASIPAERMKRFIERGLALSGSSPTRRRFYRLGSELFGAEYLQRASADSANSVRQWAVKQLQSQT